jgi:hypothetical protein
MSSESLRKTIEILGPESVESLIIATSRLSALGASLNVELTTDEILQAEVVKLFSISGVEFSDERAIAELREIPSVAAKIAERENIEASSIALQQKLSKMSRTQRMNFARENPDLTAKQGDRSGNSTADERAILAGLNPGARIAMARKLGLAS